MCTNKRAVFVFYHWVTRHCTFCSSYYLTVLSIGTVSILWLNSLLRVSHTEIKVSALFSISSEAWGSLIRSLVVAEYISSLLQDWNNCCYLAGCQKGLLLAAVCYSLPRDLLQNMASCFSNAIIRIYLTPLNDFANPAYYPFQSTQHQLIRDHNSFCHKL